MFSRNLLEVTHKFSYSHQYSITEGYRCRFGINPAIQAEFFKSDFRIVAVDEAGEVRAMEHRFHPFFIATLFQPERAALEGHTPLIVKAFLEASQRYYLKSNIESNNSN